MACFLAPMAEAVITTTLQKILEKKAARIDAAVADSTSLAARHRFSALAQKLDTLNTMLWGGSAVLAFDHVWNGELVPYYPFFTAASSPEQLSAMLHELATSGGAMALAVTACWGVMVAFSAYRERAAVISEKL